VAEGKGRQGGPLFLPTSLRLPRTHLLSVNQYRRARAHTCAHVVYVRGCSSTGTNAFVRAACAFTKYIYTCVCIFIEKERRGSGSTAPFRRKDKRRG
jgi:hypothetical protein